MAVQALSASPYKAVYMQGVVFVVVEEEKGGMEEQRRLGGTVRGWTEIMV